MAEDELTPDQRATVDEIKRMLFEGVQLTNIIRACRARVPEMREGGCKISNFTWGHRLARAVREIEASGDAVDPELSRRHNLFMRQKNYEAIIQGTLAQRDWKNAIAAVDKLAELQGLKIPKKVEHRIGLLPGGGGGSQRGISGQEPSRQQLIEHCRDNGIEVPRDLLEHDPADGMREHVLVIDAEAVTKAMEENEPLDLV